MGLFSYLKDKFSRKSDKTSKYVAGLEKSRHHFADRLKNLAKRYAQVNEAYFEELETILIEADVGINLTIRTIENLLQEAKIRKSLTLAINECSLMPCLLAMPQRRRYRKRSSLSRARTDRPLDDRC
jgi:fused signal recognition particle receptor